MPIDLGELGLEDRVAGFTVRELLTLRRALDERNTTLGYALLWLLPNGCTCTPIHFDHCPAKDAAARRNAS